jgi:hypothetical protein
MDLLSSASLVGLTFAYTTLFVYDQSIRSELRTAHLESSRFPLFAARDHLVQLAVEGKMTEDDEAWLATYRTINWLLGIERRLDAVNLLFNLVRNKVAEAKNPDLKRQGDLHLRMIRRAETETPEFKAVRDEMASGMLHMVEKRTGRVQKAILMAIVLLFTPLAERRKSAKIRPIDKDSAKDFLTQHEAAA